ncbi:hypothetical protein HHK36_002836 [Tetracentron sinense]|uniref:GRIP domain-containing protein n=1 Tax=Tetracentron sinense TaxID=13715 RepID=A0A834ZR69_TETSI|nr:hypothetical protein HHK36_002836 [Tetracentron sinense]
MIDGVNSVIPKNSTMSIQEGEINGILEGQKEDDLKPENELLDTNRERVGYLVKENGICDGAASPDDTHDQLVQMVIELKFQNEYLKAQFQGLKHVHSESDGAYGQIQIGLEGGASEDVNELHEKIESLNRKLLEQKQTQNAAEDAVKHLRAAYSEADAKAQELSSKLAEVQQKMDQEIKERDEKYTELDSKFGRLHKRAKQRIQDIQKEKDDLEARLRDVNEIAERASSQQSSLQQELERARQQANEALRAMDVERQQLRTANNNFDLSSVFIILIMSLTSRLRDSIDEARHSLEAKENALERLQQSLFDKEQMLEDMRGLLQAADEKRQALTAEFSAKHQKHLESLDAQLADALLDRNKAAETISTLQVLVAEKESKIAEMDAASTGEAARLKAAVETVKGELLQLKHEHGQEKESWEAAYQVLKTKLEVAENTRIRTEIEAAKMRSQLEFELSVQTQLLNTRDAELVVAKEEINRLEKEFSSYKVRAHALLQKKDAELAAAKDSELLKAHEEAIKEAEKEVALASAERDRALQDLQDALANHDKELAASLLVFSHVTVLHSTPNAVFQFLCSLTSAEQRIRNMEIKLDSANAHYQSEKVALQRNLENLEVTWRLRCEVLEAKQDASSRQDLENELEELKLRYHRLKEEHGSFRDIADRMIEEKDNEISRLIDDKNNLHRSIESRRSVEHNDYHNTCKWKIPVTVVDFSSQKQDAPISSTSAAEQQILILARQQAQREEELAQSQRHILALQEEIEELERENRLHSQQEAMLKIELRNMERMEKREGVDMTYLKNVILKLLETGEVEALLPVVGMLLQFSPEEVQKCQQAYRSSADVPPSPASDASGSLLSRFSFS